MDRLTQKMRSTILHEIKAFSSSGIENPDGSELNIKESSALEDFGIYDLLDKTELFMNIEEASDGEIVLPISSEFDNINTVGDVLNCVADFLAKA